jgi:hypothetical protein
LPPQQNLQIEQEIEDKNVLKFVSRTLKKKICPKEIIIIMVGTEDRGDTSENKKQGEDWTERKKERSLLLTNCYQITIYPVKTEGQRWIAWVWFGLTTKEVRQDYPLSRGCSRYLWQAWIKS